MRSRSQRSKRIKEISSQIQELSAELNTLLRIDSEDNTEGQESTRGTSTNVAAARATSTTDSEQASAYFKPGDRLRILNDYKGQRGRTGEVIYTKGEYVHFVIEDTRTKTSRKYYNARKIS